MGVVYLVRNHCGYAPANTGEPAGDPPPLQLSILEVCHVKLKDAFHLSMELKLKSSEILSHETKIRVYYCQCMGLESFLVAGVQYKCPID